MIEELVRRQLSLTKTLGKGALHSLFPKDFEYYLVAFELVNERGTVDYFTFPIQPKSISEIQPELSNIKKTAGGVIVLENETFIPTTISLRGTFGRKFKILVNGNNVDFLGYRLSIDDGKFSIKNKKKLEEVYKPFSTFAKTGYGCVKVLEAMKIKSRQPGYKLYFYNSILGNNYIVKFIDFTHSQDESTNMLPQYSITLKSIAPLDSVSESGGGEDIAKNTGISIIQKELNNGFSIIKRSLEI